MTFSTSCSYSRTATPVDSAFNPPTTRGTSRKRNSALPGSIRSGEYASRKSRPAVSPDVSSNGFTNSSVVPG